MLAPAAARTEHRASSNQHSSGQLAAWLILDVFLAFRKSSLTQRGETIPSESVCEEATTRMGL